MDQKLYVELSNAADKAFADKFPAFHKWWSQHEETLYRGSIPSRVAYTVKLYRDQYDEFKRIAG